MWNGKTGEYQHPFVFLWQCQPHLIFSWHVSLYVESRGLSNNDNKNWKNAWKNIKKYTTEHNISNKNLTLINSFKCEYLNSKLCNQVFTLFRHLTSWIIVLYFQSECCFPSSYMYGWCGGHDIPLLASTLFVSLR